MSSGSLAKRLETAVMELPQDLREVAEQNLADLRRSIDLTTSQLVGLLHDESASPELRATSAWSIGLLQESSLKDELTRTLVQTQEPLVIWEVAKALCSLGEGREEFLSLIETAPSEVHRLAAAHALGILGDSSTVPLLIQLLSCRKEPSELRARVAEALGYIGDRQALPALLSSTADPSAEVRFWAVFALGCLGDRRAVPALKQLAQEDHEMVEDWGTVAQEAALALKEIQERRD